MGACFDGKGKSNLTILIDKIPLSMRRKLAAYDFLKEPVKLL